MLESAEKRSSIDVYSSPSKAINAETSSMDRWYLIIETCCRFGVNISAQENTNYNEGNSTEKIGQLGSTCLVWFYPLPLKLSLDCLMIW